MVAGIGIAKLAVVGAIVTAFVAYPHFHSNKNNPTDTPQRTSTTQPTATPSTNATPSTSPPQLTPTIPRRTWAGRGARILDRRGLSVDTSSESYPK
jgi:hypothetical protein